jgi:hypothetical protein
MGKTESWAITPTKKENECVVSHDQKLVRHGKNEGKLLIPLTRTQGRDDKDISDMLK